MILVADAGSTKTSWALVNHSEIHFYETPGINPILHTLDAITETVHKELPTDVLKHNFDHIAFYGAGCSSDLARLNVEEGLSAILKARRIEIDHDMLGSCIATSENKPAIVSILGTGSNTCYFDGTKIVRTLSSPGYILADEGGGSQIGKRFLVDYLRGDLPEDLAAEMKNRFPLSENEILRRLYQEPGPNRFLASFVHILAEQKEHAYTRQVVHAEFQRYAESHLSRFPEKTQDPVHFTGSVASIFEEILQEVAREFSFRIGNIQQRPIEGLAKYYSQNYHLFASTSAHIND